jgi:glyoxalase family protein
LQTKDDQKKILGIHHITAIAGDPQQNINFYSGLLGLRLVKLTVNFDDPETYHLYYGDQIGHPGSILTFFLWRDSPRGLRGTGQATITSFAISPESTSFWKERLRKSGVKTEESEGQFKDEESLTFYDPDDLKLRLVASDRIDPRFAPWAKSPVPEKSAIRGFHGVTLSEEGYESTARLLTDTMGFKLVEDDGERFRYEVGMGGASTFVDVLCQPALLRGEVLVGTIHHVAFRTPNDEQQKAWRKELVKIGRNVTPVIDRRYFHSIYFREPGGVLFEIATDPPGFTLDEPEESLGTSLKLPPWLESSRKRIEASLPKVQLFQTSG